MKKSTFILVGMLLTVLAIGIMGCSSRSQQKAELNAKLRQINVEFNSQSTPIVIEALGNVGSSEAYSLKKDGVEYIVISGSSTGGVTIIKHEPVDKRLVNMDSVVANSPWIDEYSMLGYSQAEPSKQSVESLTNPEVRPVPIGSEAEFIKYHTGKEFSAVPNDGDERITNMWRGIANV